MPTKKAAPHEGNGRPLQGGDHEGPAEASPELAEIDPEHHRLLLGASASPLAAGARLRASRPRARRRRAQEASARIVIAGSGLAGHVAAANRLARARRHRISLIVLEIHNYLARLLPGPRPACGR